MTDTKTKEPRTPGYFSRARINGRGANYKGMTTPRSGCSMRLSGTRPVDELLEGVGD